MKNTRLLSGFSLMEMMVVLLIVAVVLAASAPMISKRAITSTNMPQWSWLGNDGNAGFNIGGGTMSALIGATAVDEGNPRLFIGSNDFAQPHLRLHNGTDGINIRYTTQNSIVIGNQVDINEGGTNGVAIGIGATAFEDDSVSIGHGSGALGDKAIAIGKGSGATGVRSIAIGSDNANNENQTTAGGTSAIAIGASATAPQNNSIAIGIGATIGEPANELTISSISIGSNANASGTGAIAIGGNYNWLIGNHPVSFQSSSATQGGAIAIGGSATNIGAIAIGNGYVNNNAMIGKATASGVGSVAIGPGATATHDNEIVLGNSNSIVHIPGTFVVDGDVYLANSNNHNVHINTQNNKFATIKEDFSTLLQKNLAVLQWDQQFYTIPSDRRLKDVGEAFKGGLSEIKKLEVFHYTFKKDDKKTPRVGVMAQDLQKIFPAAVIKGEDGFLRIRFEDMFYAMVNAIKELDSKVTEIANQVKDNVDMISKLQEQVQAQDKQIEELKKQNAEFEKRLAKLEKKKSKDKE